MTLQESHIGNAGQAPHFSQFLAAEQTSPRMPPPQKCADTRRRAAPEAAVQAPTFHFLATLSIYKVEELAHETD